MTTTEDVYADLLGHPETVAFEPTRQAGLARLDDFASRTSAHYTASRNYDLGPTERSTVSALSPWIRHRLITEEEVLAHTLARHSPNAAMKFIQEVFWRGYFKGWMQQHPSVWTGYQSGLRTAQNGLERNVHHNTDYQSAIGGRTGITCFDHWCHELKETGYLHNHARMWFASIWIFTLRLPWELGAHFFLTHLIDGDPASNTLSWRWVGGLHTKGKTYLARPSNIAKYTRGTFEPIGQLAQTAEPLIENDIHPFVPFVPSQSPIQKDFLFLITEEDCQPETFISGTPKDVVGLVSPREADQSAKSATFKKGAVADAVLRLGGQENATVTNDWTSTVITAAEQAGTSQVLTAFAPVGPSATKLANLQNVLAQEGITLHQQQRPYDTITWPHATKGFFKLKKMIPSILSDLGVSDAQTF
ncbi:Deoxyribodipyrimidine photo-lyase [Shimia thalassica]|uniref:Deoxyribodipyrimidine photo-lyase n=1 Tax=Shimia thalassica TaxID=1715693 RepID=A0A0P1IB94_9RHOB|nr:FAD-binding domain-containing protein [Shimia thalassica]CUK02885.1 Deoxyribodipyrimidine photo-lyase [Shimia thalassica]